MTRLAILLACAIASGNAASAQQLSTAVVPDHYDLSFDIDLARARFDGRTGIDVRLAQPVRSITLNALDMTIASAAITASGKTHAATISMNADAQSATLAVADPIPAGRARLDIVYSAPLNDKLRGLYLSKANNRSYAVTQLESTDARRAFPSFDEPSMKATFTITVTTAKGDVAISNGRIVSDAPGPRADTHTMTFSTTARMSTYLVAIAVGDFQCLEGASDGVPIRICATPDKKELAHIALESAERILTFLDGYHTIKYPFGKLDVVAVPDFAAGAMENAGAIFYRETDLLADSSTASLAARKTIFGVLAHEMAHMWFGDLVTMQWWDDIWLNEGFATWMATRPAAAAHPEWHMEVDEVAETQTAMGLDSLESTHPLHVNVESPGEIEGAFDPISYEKGASVVRMVEAYVGADAFRNGVNAYLEKYQYANATSENFMAAITAASGKPVDRIMGTFVMQAGFPQIDVAVTCSNGRTDVTLSQKRFTLDERGSSGERWQIPVCVKIAPGSYGAASNCVVMTEEKMTFPVAGGVCAPWVFANVNGKGYYRTAYTPAMLEAIAPSVETSLTAPERLSLVSDEWALVRAGRHSVANYLDLAAGFGDEPIGDVLGVVTGRLSFVNQYLINPEQRPKFRSFVRNLLQRAYQSVGFDASAGDTDDRRTLRRILVSALGNIAEDTAVIQRARQAVDGALAGTSRLDPIIATTLVNLAAAHGDAALFDALRQAAKNARDPQERNRYLFALTSFTQPALLQRALDYTLSPELRSQDAAIYLASFFGGADDATHREVWDFIKAHWTELEPKVTISLGDVNLVGSLANFCSADARDDIAAFFKVHKLPAAERTLTQTIERINNCITMKEQQQGPLNDWLAAR